MADVRLSTYSLQFRGFCFVPFLKPVPPGIFSSQDTVCISVYAHAHMCVCVCARARIHVSVCTFMHMSVCAHTYG